MTDFLALAFGLPTVLFTLPLLLAMVYWLFAMVGVLDIEIFEALDGLDGAMEGVDAALDGLDGALEGVDGALDGAEADVDAADGMDTGDSWEAIALFASVLRLGRVPVTVTLSLFLLGAWVTSYVGAWALLRTPFVPTAIGQVVVFMVAFVGGVAFTNLFSRPAEPMFREVPGRRRSALVGETAEVRTGRVDAGFGQALVTLGGDELLVQVRLDVPNTLSRGDEVLLVNFDAQREAFVVEPLGTASATTDSSAASQES